MPINTYDKSNTLSTTIKPSGMDIGPIPDFWGDLGAVVNRLRPVQQQMGGGQAQAAALRAPAYVNTAAQARENNRDPEAEHLRSMQIRAQLQALDDASRPPPMTYRPAGPQTTGGRWQMDSNAMNANQRRMFLPSQSNLAPADIGNYSDLAPGTPTGSWADRAKQGVNTRPAPNNNNLMQGARDTAQASGYQGANGGGGGKGVSGGGYGYQGPDWYGTSLPEISMGLGPIDQVTARNALRGQQR